MPKRGKKYNNAIAAVDRSKLFDLGEALDHVLQCKFAKFDESVDVAVQLGVRVCAAHSTIVFTMGAGV